MTADDTILEVGYVGKLHGLRGDVFVRSYSGSFDALLPGGVVTIRLTNQDQKKLTIESTRPFKQGALVRFAGHASLAAVETFRGAKLFVNRGNLPELMKDEVFLVDLIGLKVVSPAGEHLGKITDIADTGPIPSIVVAGIQSGAVPYHRDWVEAPDFVAGTLQLKQDLIR